MAANNPPGTPRRRGGPPLDLAESALIARVNISAKNPSESIANCRAPCYGIGVTQDMEGEAMLTVHHLNNSRSQRVLWLLEELGVAYEIVRYQRQPDMRAPAELRAVHPLGKSPVITDNGNTIAESGAIVEYLIDTYGEGRLIPPPKTPERLRYTYWLHYAEGSAMPPLLLKLLFTLMPKRAPALLRPLVRKVSNQALTTLVNPQLKQHMAFWESELAKSEWFAGSEFTAADIQMSFPLEAAAARGGLEQGHPKAMAFLERIHARPAYQRALEKGGPYHGGKVTSPRPALAGRGRIGSQMRAGRGDSPRIALADRAPHPNPLPAKQAV